MLGEDLEPPAYEDCAVLPPPVLTIDVKDTGVYTPHTNHRRTHYRTTSSLNRDFVKGGFGLFRVNPYKASETVEVCDIRAVGDARFRIVGLERGVERRAVTCQRKFGFSGHSWEVKTSDARTEEEGRGDMVFSAKRTSKEDSTLRWCDASGRLIATDTKLVRRRGNRENYFLMPVLTLVAEAEQEVLDLLVASWLARVWVDVVHAKKKSLMDGAYL